MPHHRAGEAVFGAHQTRHRGSVTGGRCRAGQATGSFVACRNHRFECFAFVLEVSLGRLDQIGNQVVAPLELHFDLREGVL
jgi:hypothetical protein